ncbi:MAG: AAA family ATPase [Candidatus Spechtbacterales bacterium]
MKITKITIENYRSIKETPFNIIKRDDNSFTYGLIGINEAGKSSILKAIGLKDGLVDDSGTKLPLLKDFRLKEEIKITYRYSITSKEDKELYEILNKEDSVDNPVPNLEKEVSAIEGGQTQDVEDSKIKEVKKPKNKILSSLIADYVISFSKASADPEYSTSVFEGDQEIEINNKDEFDNFIEENVHKTIFWTAEDRYLISKPINIEQFINDTNTSIPLRNCFLLSSISQDKIKQELEDALADTPTCEYLEKRLGKNVTEHINTAWPKHPIEITFKIMDGHINFHVKDIDTEGKAQTSDMRSDGFKQFISFLLTVVAENKNEELQNTIILLDEPETHLHPKAQEHLLAQLVEITNNSKSNIVLFATHSNYMIDKKDLGRYYRVEKIKNQNNEEYTNVREVDELGKKQTSYAEVSYEVFDILDEQYHNELYDKLRDWFVNDKNSKEKDESKHIESIGINAFDEQYLKQIKKAEKDCTDTSKPKVKNAKVTLPTFIRNCIHYPANKKGDFDEKLKESIDILRGYIESDVDSLKKL